MLIWLVKDGENVPVQSNARSMRMGMLAEALVGRGHSVAWWCSTFSHQRKTLLYSRDTEVEVKPGLELILLHAGGYQGNISVRRYLHHRRLARKMRKGARGKNSPDLIVSAFPIIDLAHETVVYARAQGIPVVVDIRDLWPDTFLDRIPRWLRGMARILLARDFARTRQLLRKADSLVAISRGCLRWGLRYAGRPPSDEDRVFYTGYPDEEVEAHRPSDRILDFKRQVEGKTVFVFVGSFGYSYEFGLICEVAQRLGEMGQRGVHFVMAGDGQQFRQISRRAERLPNMSLLGWLDKLEIVDLLHLCHVGLVPCKSVVDAMPNKPFEYLSAGLPILSSLEGEMEEIIAEHGIGYSYRPGDAGALCNLVIKLCSDGRLRERQARNARALFEQKFSARIIYRAYANHLEDLWMRRRKAALA